MSFLHLRNQVISRLTDYLGCPVILADQTSDEPQFPFLAYSIVSSYLPAGGVNDSLEDGDGLSTVRREQPDMVFSFTACSMNRGKILGEDEAILFAERAQGWFLHVGYPELSRLGLVVAEVGNVSSRSVLEIDEEARRWGFDVRIRYTRIDIRPEENIERVKYGKE